MSAKSKAGMYAETNEHTTAATFVPTHKLRADILSALWNLNKAGVFVHGAYHWANIKKVKKSEQGGATVAQW
jgi:hypothetical protein